MGLLGAIAGGVLQGTGQAMMQDITERRRVALENLRASNDAALAEAKDTRAAARDEARDDRKYERDMGLLTAGAKYDVLKDQAKAVTEANVVIPAKTSGEVTVAQAKAGADERLARVKADLDMRNDEASRRLAQQIEGGEIQDIRQTDDGTYQIIKKRGNIVTTKTKGALPASKAVDPFEAMLNERMGGGQPAAGREAAEAPRTTPPVRTAPADVAPIADPADLTRAYTKATALAAKGDPRFAGKSASQIKKIVDDGLIAKGYRLPR